MRKAGLEKNSEGVGGNGSETEEEEAARRKASPAPSASFML